MLQLAYSSRNSAARLGASLSTERSWERILECSRERSPERSRDRSPESSRERSLKQSIPVYMLRLNFVAFGVP